MDTANRDLMMASLQRMAMRMLEVPPPKRERAYEAFNTDFLKNVPAEDMAPKAAEEFGRRYLELLRAMVKLIEIGGGVTRSSRPSGCS